MSLQAEQYKATGAPDKKNSHHVTVRKLSYFDVLSRELQLRNLSILKDGIRD